MVSVLTSSAVDRGF